MKTLIIVYRSHIHNMSMCKRFSALVYIQLNVIKVISSIVWNVLSFSLNLCRKNFYMKYFFPRYYIVLSNSTVH
ncbi:unnamed protein product [Heterobilharzia americana]|nr:unnamed protein product [Heterobilharzia americana]